ncbi:MAG: HAMP domain-containing protein [Gemmatimonadetes bacterium]|jgi:class 3 adenylate cyclase|nr:HAMP domain-containing protein [Gemmatimonadota bacterium]MBT6148892.1 HAMP domain-containing protein [Gemmatimonadota bacterium]MBT7864396.1 HAMP domain-containing protein [Gemmatimonadota bacterium]
MKTSGRRISFGFKVISLATVMLGLLVLTSLYSYWRLGEVGEELEEMNTYLTPLGKQVNGVVHLALQQEIHFERQIIALGDEAPNRPDIESERNHFETKGKEVELRLDRALDLVHQAVAGVAQEDDRMALTRLEPILEGLRMEHRDFHQHALRVVALMDTGVSGGQARASFEAHVETLLAQLEEEEDDITGKVEQYRIEAVALREDAVAESLAHQKAVLHASIAAVVSAMLMGLLGALYLTARLVQPIRQLMGAMEKIGQGHLDVEVKTNSSDEIGELSQAFGDMVSELGRRDSIKSTFGKYVDPRVVEHLIGKAGALETGGENREMTVLFANVDEIATLADQSEPAELVRLINQYLSLMVVPIFRHRGVVDKFIDTMVMAFWGAPFTGEEEHAQLACEASLDLVAQLEEIRHLVGRGGEAEADPNSLHLRIGLSSGPLLVGNMGSDQSKSYTVLGDTVNIASRLKGVCKQYGATILMTEETHRMTENTMETRELDLVQVVGREEPVRVYELLGRRGSIDSGLEDLRDRFERGLEAYRQQDWDSAQAHFEGCLEITANDGPTAQYLERVRHLRAEPPGDTWDGVWHLTHK